MATVLSCISCFCCCYGCAQTSASLRSQADQDRVVPAKVLAGKSGWDRVLRLGLENRISYIMSKRQEWPKNGKQGTGQGVLGDFSTSKTPTQLWPPLSLMWNLTQLFLLPGLPTSTLNPTKPPHSSNWCFLKHQSDHGFSCLKPSNSFPINL